jgi:hypothetical protein
MSKPFHPAINNQLADEIHAHVKVIQRALEDRNVDEKALNTAFERLPQLVLMAQIRLNTMIINAKRGK